MVVAGAGLTHRGVARARDDPPGRRGAGGDFHDALEQPSHLGAGQPVIAVPTLLLHAEQAR
jgi:hypothetical protein